VLGKGVGFSHFLSLGNEADVTETDMMEYLADDADTTVIAIYAEGIRDGRRFIDAARKVTARKPVLILKAGRSEEGARAVSSHTGSLAGSHAAYQAAFKQSGVIEVKNATDLLNAAMALDWLKIPTGSRAAIITNAGGPAALASDSLAENGIQLASISALTQAKLREKLNPAAQVSNPIDMLGGATELEYGHALESVLADEGVDMVLAVLVPQALVDPVKVAQSFVDAARKSDKPVLACMMGSYSVQEARDLLHQNHLPMTDYPEQTGMVFGALRQYAQIRQRHETTRGFSVKKDHVLAEKILDSSKSKIWGEHVTRPLLKTYGVSLVEGELAADLPEAQKTAARLGYPVVIKAASEDVLHKSDFGAIAVNIGNDLEMESSYQRILENVKKHAPKAVIEGILVEKMAPKGLEVIIGMKRDPGFGPLMMFGMGGIFVELFKDVAFRVAPLTYTDAKEMVAETKAAHLLSGWRGGQESDLDAIIENILRLSELAVDFPQIQEIEINPLLVLPKGQGALALDCRMILA
jgi:acetyltransferase